MALVSVALAVQSKDKKWFSKDFRCLRPHVGETILLDSDEFEILDVALHAGVPEVAVQAVMSRGKRLSAKALTDRGFKAV